jgi:DNA-binding winged helix-turn-helix (wHTH) protein
MVPIDWPEQQESSDRAALSPRRFVCFGVFCLDLKKEELFQQGTRINLQGKVHQALLALLHKPGQLVTREELRMHLWPSGTHVNYDANVNTTVNKLRKVLGDSPDQPVYVETIPQRGYSLVAKIEYADRPPAPPAPKPARLTAVAPGAERQGLFFETALLSGWFTAGVVTLVIASMLFGAALVLYARR